MFAAMTDGAVTDDIKTRSQAVPVSQELPTRVAVIGTGNFGRAIVNKVRSAGFDVIWGSRSPVEDQVPVEKVMMESLLILAVPSYSWSSLPLSHLQVRHNWFCTSVLYCTVQPGTIILDPSNRRSRCEADMTSQAESLQHLLPPGVSLVKCLNTLSAYELENQTFVAGKQVSWNHLFVARNS